MIKGTKSDFVELIKDCENTIKHHDDMIVSTQDRINGYRKRMEQFGAEDYYKEQIAEEEEFVVALKKYRNNTESFLKKLNESYEMQYQN